MARERSFNTLAVTRTLNPGASFDHTFLVGWHFPNLITEARPGSPSQREVSYYGTQFSSSAEVLRYVQAHLADLTARTRNFHAAVC